VNLFTVLVYRELLESFWREWFSVYPWLGREALITEKGNKKNRKLFSVYDDFHTYITECSKKRLPCYISVQPFYRRNVVAQIEKLFFDFDAAGKIQKAWEEAKQFALLLKTHYNVEPLLCFSGRKGYHIYVYLQKPIKLDESQQHFAKQFYSRAQYMLLKGLHFEILDMQVLGDIKRLARVPYTIHEKTGFPCIPISLQHTPLLIESLMGFRTHGLSEQFVKVCMNSVAHKSAPIGKSLKKKYSKGIRPCIEAALNQQLNGPNGHLMRLAIAREYLAAGLAVMEVVGLFRSQRDFDAEKTRYYVEYACKNPGRPFKCETICKLGFCLGERCPIYQARLKGKNVRLQ